MSDRLSPTVLKGFKVGFSQSGPEDFWRVTEMGWESLNQIFGLFSCVFQILTVSCDNSFLEV